jgi:hypothetical protein
MWDLEQFTSKRYTSQFEATAITSYSYTHARHYVHQVQLDNYLESYQKVLRGCWLSERIIAWVILLCNPRNC